MGNQNNVNISPLIKQNLINKKTITNKVKLANNINFFLDMLVFPEEEKMIVSTPQSLMIFESTTFQLIQTLEITNLNVLQNINNNKNNIKNGIDRTYSFFASKGGSWACVYLCKIDFNDYTFFTQEIIRKHMPKYCFLNFFELSTNLIVIAFEVFHISYFPVGAKSIISPKNSSYLLNPIPNPSTAHEYLILTFLYCSLSFSI